MTPRKVLAHAAVAALVLLPRGAVAGSVRVPAAGASCAPVAPVRGGAHVDSSATVRDGIRPVGLEFFGRARSAVALGYRSGAGTHADDTREITA